MALQFKNRWAYRVQNALLRRRRPPSRPETFVAELPVHADWDEAYVRVESYLRAHHIESRIQLNRLTTDIVDAARHLAAEQTGEVPVTLAIRIAQARIGEWLVQAMKQGDWADERFRAQGRLALLLSEIPQQCPERFLARAKLPDDIKKCMTEARLIPGPDVRLASMPSAPLEFPLTEAVEEKWTTFNRSAFFRASMSWLLIGTFAGFLWIATR